MTHVFRTWSRIVIKRSIHPIRPIAQSTHLFYQLSLTVLDLYVLPRHKILTSTFSKTTGRQGLKNMVDPKRVVSYEDMLKVIHQPEKVIIDVRNPDEISSTGKIPSSINIPLGNVQDALVSMSEAEFQRQYQRSKPSASDELIFYCRTGRRSSEALDKALKLGYSKSKTYLGSWEDWSSRQK